MRRCHTFSALAFFSIPFFVVVPENAEYGLSKPDPEDGKDGGKDRALEEERSGKGGPIEVERDDALLGGDFDAGAAKILGCSLLADPAAAEFGGGDGERVFLFFISPISRNFGRFFASLSFSLFFLC